MATKDQSSYIADLVVKHTKEFKEVKELLIANQIVGDNAEIVKNAGTIHEITHALTDSQASRFIDVLIATKEPTRGSVYSEKRVNNTIKSLDGIKDTIADWGFES